MNGASDDSLEADLDIGTDADERRAADTMEILLAAHAHGESVDSPALPREDRAAFALGTRWLAEDLPPIDPAFQASLRADLAHFTAAALPNAAPPPGRQRPRPPSRRAVIAGSLGVAAGLAAGASLAIGLTRQPEGDPAPVPLVGNGGAWLTIARIDELLPGMVKRFATDQVVGHLIRRNDGSFAALSAACTHMGCIVAWNDLARTFDCPCHGGRFDSTGQFVNGLVRYRPLPTLETRVTAGQVQIFLPLPPKSATPTPGNSDYSG